MTLRKPAQLRGGACHQSLTLKQSPTILFPGTLTLPLTLLLSLPLILIVTLLLTTVVNAAPASQQNSPPAAKPANTQALPLSNPPQRRQRRPTWRISKVAPKVTPTEADPGSEAVSTPLAGSPATSEAVSIPLAVSPAPAPAASPQSADDRLPFMAGDERDSQEQPPSAAGLLVRTLGALLLIVGLIVAAAWGIKRFGGARFGTPQENAPPLAVLNSLSLGDRRSLTIVRFGDRTLLLGSTAHAVTLLAEAETDDFTAPARSVADILNDEEPVAFSQELFSATRNLAEQPETRRGADFTA